MRPETTSHPIRHRTVAQRGFTVVAAIFLLVLFAGLAALMMTISTSQQGTSAQDVQGARAYQAARAGIEWGVYQWARNGACNASATPTFGGSLAGFTVTVTCANAGAGDAGAGAGNYLEGGATIQVRTITATAVTTGIAVGSLGYIERQIQVTVN